MRRFAISLLGTGLLAGMAIPATAADTTLLCGGYRVDIVGTEGPDNIEGTPGQDVIAALGGDDVIRGFGAGDHLCGGRGNDVLYGLHSYDELWGGSGNDQLHGGELADRLYGGPGDDLLDGGPAGEDYRWDEVGLQDAVRGVRVDLTAGTATGQGQDTLVSLEIVHGSAYDDVIRGNAGPYNMLDGRQGSDILRGGGGGTDYFDGDAGNDRLFGSDNSNPSGTEFPAYDQFFPGASNDLARGRGGRNFFMDSRGHDVFSGGDGVDSVQEWSGPDSDLIRTYGGPDVVEVADGDPNDRVYAGRGEDRCTAERGDFVSSCTRMRRIN